MGDTDGFGTDRRRMGTGQLVAAVGGGAGPPQLGHRTSQRPGILASAVLAALVAAHVAVHPNGNTEIAEFQRVYKMPATEVQEQH